MYEVYRICVFFAKTVCFNLELGVIEPIIVWKDPESGKTCVVAGRQRVKNATEANARRKREGLEPWPIPGTAKRGSVIQMAKNMVSENEITQPDTPLGRAKKWFSRWSTGMTKVMSICFSAVALKLSRLPWRILDATQAVQTAVESEKVTVTQARQLVDMHQDKQRETVKQFSSQALSIDNPSF